MNTFVTCSPSRFSFASSFLPSTCTLRFTRWSTAMPTAFGTTTHDDAATHAPLRPTSSPQRADSDGAPTASNVEVSGVSEVIASAGRSSSPEVAEKESNLVNGASVTSVGMYYSPQFLKHRAPPGRNHPERPERLTAIVNALKADPELSSCVEWLDPPALDDAERTAAIMEAVERVHSDSEYLDELKQVSKNGGALDGDTYVAPGSWEISLLAVSAWMAAVDRTMACGQPSFALARPPGHHATPKHGMGFCLLSNAAIAAKYALQKHGLSHVAILDWDVHHGNGTEAAVAGDERIRFVSSHEYPLYPMSGLEGRKDNVLNINLEAGTSMDDYWPRYKEEMLPHLFVDGEPPELVIVSAGFDALDDDPLANIELEPEDFGRLVRGLVDKVGHNRIMLGLEGGYSLESVGISGGVCETIRGLLAPRD